ncbi:prepilin peptidase [uncultured Aureimonas sp.]|uniref:A24 family peptidase n=1 Tax=uncultured Aureimonas sp. TaxID=1604662 RepID=UPI0025EE4CC4|nr:prepilin peptidase [uncultured Aureimonas sp.]
MASLLVLVFAAAMIAAALTDLASMTIANRLVVALAAAFLPFGLAAGLTATAFLLHLAAGMGVLAITFGCFAAGWMGGGDAKLMAAVALWLGPTPELASFALWTSILGGVLTLAFLAARSLLSPTTGLAPVDRLLRSDTGIPYGVAIGAAGLAMVPAMLASLPA